MKQFAIWYFETGWIMAMLIAAYLGYLSAKYDKPWLLITTTLSLLVFGAVMLYFKQT